MELREVVIIVFAALILGFSAAFPNFSLIYAAVLSMFIIVVVNFIAKKVVAYYLEADIKLKFWEIYHFYWPAKSHFKKPMPLFWISPLLSLISLGNILWLAILEFDVSPRPERASRRHGMYRFTEMTDWHVGTIATWGIVANLFLAVSGYLLGFGMFAKLNVYFALWSLLPIGSLDGTKILFGSRVLWMAMLILAAIFFGFTAFVV